MVLTLGILLEVLWLRTETETTVAGLTEEFAVKPNISKLKVPLLQ